MQSERNDCCRFSRKASRRCSDHRYLQIHVIDGNLGATVGVLAVGLRGRSPRFNNALNNLLGYPHGQWRQLARDVRGDEEAVAQALMAWRDEAHRKGGGQCYFDALL
jgi:hypothetical protein